MPAPGVRLAPGCLALLLCRQQDGGCPAPEQVFRDFQAANLRCYWNQRLAAAAARVCFQGWLRGWVLLVRGDRGELEVLRDAWVRRALRPPRGFTVRAVGDVSPVQMSPASQSQFIPLAEVVCSAISDMNAAHVVVTQETLMEELVKHYPGIATPSKDILYSTLGNLIKERKIYHTGEGYFIVTPQTYFITNNATKEDGKGPQDDDNPPLPPSVTYLVSMESCADSTKANIPTVSHCPSCQCFSDQLTQNTQELPSIGEHRGKVQKHIKEARPLIQNQATSTSVQNEAYDLPKPAVSLKEKEKCSRKFGLSLFRRNASKKDKPKKEYTTFTAQFPPEEWPVRDEDDMANIPRDIEHAIIKRINPVLTVDNLKKHTVLMQRAEQQKKYISKGTSTEVLTARQKHHSKGSVRKKHHRPPQHRRKLQPSEEKPAVKSKKEFPAEECVRGGDHQIDNVPIRPTSSGIGRTDVALQKTVKKKIPIEDESQCVYKKLISNPFQGVPYREAPFIKGYRGQAKCDVKESRNGKVESSIQRSRSLDSTRTKNIENDPQRANVERLAVESKNKDLCKDRVFSMTSVKEAINEYASDFQECDTVRRDDKCKRFRECSSVHNANCVKPSNDIGSVQQQALLHNKSIAANEQEVTQYHLSSKGVFDYDTTSVIYEFLQRTSAHGQSFGICNETFRLSETAAIPRQYIEPQHKFISTNEDTCPELNHAGHEDYTDVGQNLYHKEVEDDGCSSLYLEDNYSDDNTDMCQMLPNHRQPPFTDACDFNTNQAVQTAGMQNSWSVKSDPSQYNGSTPGFDPSFDNEEHEHCELQETRSSCDYREGRLQEDLYRQQETSPSFNPNTVEGSVLTDSLQVSDMVDGSIFDYCNTSEVDSQAEALPKSSNEGEDKSTRWGLDQRSGEVRKHFDQNVKLFNTAHGAVMSQSAQRQQNHMEGTENLSITGDSGIDSPRTRISLASNNSIILDGLKRRILLPNMEGLRANSRGRGLYTKNALLQQTPVINV